MRPKLKRLARAWNRWANEYDAQAGRLREGDKIAVRLRAWADAYRNAAALLVAAIGEPAMERGEWLKSLKPGDAVVAHSQYAKPALQRVVFVDSEKIFYGPSEYPDWVWIGNGAALLGTQFWRRVERPE